MQTPQLEVRVLAFVFWSRARLLGSSPCHCPVRPAHQLPLIGIHQENRDGSGCSVAHCHQLCTEFFELGFSPELTNNGEAIKRGMKWTIISHLVVQQYPKLPLLVQAAAYILYPFVEGWFDRYIRIMWHKTA